MTVTIYHNPGCSKSRQTLALLEENGIDPEVIFYLETPPSAQDLKAILAALGKRPRDTIRKGEAVYKELGLDDNAKSDVALITAMAQNPILIERPIVINAKRAAPNAKIGRPPEAVLDIL